MAVILPSKEEIQEINRNIILNDSNDDSADAGQFLKENTLDDALNPFLEYETVSEAAYGLAQAIAGNHVFVNGNKRTATEVVKKLFALNGFTYNIDLIYLVNSLVKEDGDDDEQVKTDFIEQVSDFFHQ